MKYSKFITVVSVGTLFILTIIVAVLHGSVNIWGIVQATIISLIVFFAWFGVRNRRTRRTSDKYS
jgi:O-antigen/teichoic acid export membrane protein